MLKSDTTRETPLILERREPVHEVSLVVIDDNRLLREGITSMLMREEGCRVLASSADVPKTLSAIAELHPTVVLLDFGLAAEDSLDVCTRIQEISPTTHVIVMGVAAPQNDVAEFIRCGASGFVMKDASTEEFVETIRMVAAGEQALPRALTHSLFEQVLRDEVVSTRDVVDEGVYLTTREREITHLLGEGLSNKQIAERLHIAVHTVKSHVHNILEKLSLHTRMEVAAYAHRRSE